MAEAGQHGRGRWCWWPMTAHLFLVSRLCLSIPFVWICVASFASLIASNSYQLPRGFGRPRALSCSLALSHKQGCQTCHHASTLRRHVCRRVEQAPFARLSLESGACALSCVAPQPSDINLILNCSSHSCIAASRLQICNGRASSCHGACLIQVGGWCQKFLK